MKHPFPRPLIPTLSNRFYHAEFTTEGGLIRLRANGSHRPMVIASNVSYSVHRRTYSDTTDAAERGFTIREVGVEANSIHSVLISPHLKITRRFRCEPDHPLLTIDLLIEAGRKKATLADVRLPQIMLADDFLSVIEGDERDLYFDGAELGSGRQLPCWRVFFHKGHRHGLLLATRSKRMMGHIQIWPRTERCLECRPHLLCNYSSDYNTYNAPVTLERGQQMTMTLEVGPWQQRHHDGLLLAAKLNEPHVVGRPATARRRRPMGLPGKVFSAVDIAPSHAIGEGNQRDRWMIAAEAATRFPHALFANSGYRPPMLKFKPALRGLHRIFVGVGTSYRACLKLSGEPHLRYRHLPCNAPNLLPWRLQLNGTGKPTEADFGIADMTAQTVSLGMPYCSQGHGTLDYIRFVPLGKDEARTFRAAARRKPTLPLTGFADTYDIGCMWGDAADPSTDPYRAIIWAHAQAGFDRVFWRIDGECSDFPTKHGTLRPISCWAHNAYEPFAKAYSLMLHRHDLLKAAVEAGKQHGVAIWGWMRMNSYLSGARSRFFLEHPPFHDHGERGNVLDFRLNFARPEVRRHKINILVDAASYGLPGLSLGFLRHPPIICYPPDLVESYRRTYRTEPPRDITPDYWAHLNTLPESTSEYDRWYRHRAHAITLFGRELRAALAARKLGHVKISIWVRPNHCLFDGIDLDAWLDESLCDEVVAGPYAGDPKLLRAHASWRRKVQARVPLIGGIMPIGGSDWPEARVATDIRRFIKQKWDGLCTYECNDAVNMQDMIRQYEQLRLAAPIQCSNPSE